MNRRRFLRLLGLAPAAVVATKLPPAPLTIAGQPIYGSYASPAVVGETWTIVVPPSMLPLIRGEIGTWSGVKVVENVRLPEGESIFARVFEGFPWTSTNRS